MTQSQTLTVRSFSDRAEGLAHFLLRAGEAPRLIAYDDAAGCPMDNALAALEWSGAVGILHDGDLIHAARLSNEAAVAVAVVERGAGPASQFVYLGPRLDAPPMELLEGTVLYDEPGVRAIGFSQRAHELAHFLRATSGAGALFSFLSRRGPEVRQLRRWLSAIIHELGIPRAMVGGWFAAGMAGSLFVGGDGAPSWRYIEVGLES